MKNHKHEVGIERAHHKETQRKAKGLETEVESLRERLKVHTLVLIPELFLLISILILSDWF